MDFLKRKRIKFTDLDRVIDNTESTDNKKCFESKVVSKEDLGKCYGTAAPNESEPKKYESGWC